MGAIYRRELRGFFETPSAYVFIGVFLALASVFFGVGNLAARSSDLMLFLSNLSYLFMLLSPVLTMRLIAGERKQKTDQMLFSSPCSVSGIVLGKYAAAVTVLLITVALTFLYVLLIALFGTLYPGETFVGYLGFFLLGGAFLALDLFVSCFAGTPATAAVLGVGVNLLFWLADLLAGAVTVTAVSDTLSFLSLYQRFLPFTQGQLRFSNLLYDLIFIAIMLFLSVRVLDARRWSEA